MASVAIPLIASFVVNKVGESQGWDPRMTAVLGAVAGFGAGSLVSAGSAVAASAATSAGGTAATTGGMAAGRGALGTALKAKGLIGTGGSALGQAGSLSTSVNPHGSWFSPDRLAAGVEAGPGPYRGFMGGVSSSDAPTGMLLQNYRVPPGGFANGPRSIPNHFQAQIDAEGVNVIDSGSMYSNAPVNQPKKLTMFDALGDEWGKWTDRQQYENVKGTDAKGNPTVTRVPVLDGNGKPIKKASALDNFGVSALKTLMKDLPPEPQIRTGGGGGGPQAPAYQGGGSGSRYQTVWSFGQPNQGYKPQGI